MILVSMERGDPTLYHGTKQSYFGPVNFKFVRGVVTTPLGKSCYKKRLGRTRVKACTNKQPIGSNSEECFTKLQFYEKMYHIMGIISHIISYQFLLPYQNKHQKQKVTINHLYSKKQTGNGGEGWKAKQAL